MDSLSFAESQCSATQWVPIRGASVVAGRQLHLVIAHNYAHAQQLANAPRCLMRDFLENLLTFLSFLHMSKTLVSAIFCPSVIPQVSVPMIAETIA